MYEKQIMSKYEENAQELQSEVDHAMPTQQQH